MNQPGLRFATRHMWDKEAAASPAMSSGELGYWGGGTGGRWPAAVVGRETTGLNTLEGRQPPEKSQCRLCNTGQRVQRSDTSVPCPGLS